MNPENKTTKWICLNENTLSEIKGFMGRGTVIKHKNGFTTYRIDITFGGDGADYLDRWVRDADEEAI